MRVSRIAAALILLLLCSSICSATVTVWFNDGTSRTVYRIEFPDRKTAVLTLMDGATMTVPADKIDLNSSGIAEPVGAYGGARLTSRHNKPPAAPPATLGSDSKRQAQLQEEWSLTEQSAVATADIGNIRKGDVVKIGSRTEEEPQTEPSPYLQYNQPAADNAYVVIYKTPDGIFAKRLFDAATFASNFKMVEKPVSNVVLPLSPPSETPAEQPAAQTARATPTAPVLEVQPPAPVQRQPRPARGRRLFRLALLVLLVVAAGAFVLLMRKRSRRPFVDTSRFRQYEEELRDFEIEIWLKHGKTPEQLMDICIKKFYQDNPAAMSVIQKMLKGIDKNGIVPFIMRQAGMTAEEAEQTYVEFAARIEAVRRLIKQVAVKTGHLPASPPPAPSSQPVRATTPIAPPAAKPASTPAAPVKPAPPAAQAPALPDPYSVDASGLPLYLQGVSRQLGGLR